MFSFLWVLLGAFGLVNENRGTKAAANAQDNAFASPEDDAADQQNMAKAAKSKDMGNAAQQMEEHGNPESAPALTKTMQEFGNPEPADMQHASPETHEHTEVHAAKKAPSFEDTKPSGKKVTETETPKHDHDHTGTVTKETGGGKKTLDDDVTPGGGEEEPPMTQAEIDAFVQAVRLAEDTHSHAHGSLKAIEHMQVLDLVSPDDATHIAIGNGSWFDPANWHNGEVPGDDARVIIPEGKWLTYDQESDARLFTVRIDGQLDFATDVDSKMVVDTIVVAPSGVLTAGTVDNPVADDVNVDIVIANNGPIDTDWDPALLSRGLISHGHTEMHGQIKDAHEKVIEDPMAGDTSLTFAEIPEGWEVGDKLVIAGTRYEGYKYSNLEKATVFHEPEDEVRYISKIDGNVVYFEEPLLHDHDAPREDLFTSVANYSRSITIRTENGDDAEVYERGHVMLMHSDDVDVRYVAFDQLGRTDKSGDLFDADAEGAPPISFDSNVAGRYSLHLHRSGISNQDDPSILEGNAVFGSPGWGIVHHDSHAVIEGNATYDTFGAGFVAETGNETGSWTDNIAIFSQGVRWGGAKGINDIHEGNIGISGDGFWFTGRLVDSSDNVAASVNHGFIYFHRVKERETFDAEHFDYPDAVKLDDAVNVNETPILTFEDNEAFAARMGLHVVKGGPAQGHDVHSVMNGFTAWSVVDGVGLQYTAHYVLIDFDLIGKEGDGTMADPEVGISLGKNTYDMAIVDANITGFETGINLSKLYSDNMNVADDETHGFSVINANLDGNTNGIENVTADDLILIDPVAEADMATLEMGNMFYDGGDWLSVEGTKTDSLGTHDFPNGPDNYDLRAPELAKLVDKHGYYTDENGTDYFVMDIYFSDSMTGDIFKQSELVEFADGVLGQDSGHFVNAPFNGKVNLSDLKAMTEDSAVRLRDNDDVEARTIADFEEHAALMINDGGETVMAHLSNGETLSETHHNDMDHDAEAEMHMEMDPM